MGYRAHTITQHRDYGSAVFCDWEAFQDYFSYLREAYETELFDKDALTFYENDAQDFYEIPKVVLEREIERLEKLPPDSTEPLLGEEVHYVIDSFRHALKEAVADDTYVAVEWY